MEMFAALKYNQGETNKTKYRIYTVFAITETANILPR